MGCGGFVCCNSPLPYNPSLPQSALLAASAVTTASAPRAATARAVLATRRRTTATAAKLSDSSQVEVGTHMRLRL